MRIAGDPNLYEIISQNSRIQSKNITKKENMSQKIHVFVVSVKFYLDAIPILSKTQCTFHCLTLKFLNPYYLFIYVGSFICNVFLFSRDLFVLSERRIYREERQKEKRERKSRVFTHWFTPQKPTMAG